MEIKKDDVACAYAILKEEDDRAKEEDEKTRREEAREELKFGVFGDEEKAEENVVEENAEEAPPEAMHASNLSSFPSPKIFAEIKRDFVAWAYALLAEETSRTKEEEEKNEREEARRELGFRVFDEGGSVLASMPEAQSSNYAK